MQHSLSEVALVRGSRTAIGAVILLSSPAAAQVNPADPEILPGIPTSALPPEGMCRVWLKDVPVNRQPAATDCSSAIKSRPRDAILLIGDPGANARPPARSPVNSLTRSPNDDPFNRRRPNMSPAERAVRQMEQERMAAQAARGAQPAATAGAAPTATVKVDSKAAVVAKPPE